MFDLFATWRMDSGDYEEMVRLSHGCGAALALVPNLFATWRMDSGDYEETVRSSYELLWRSLFAPFATWRMGSVQWEEMVRLGVCSCWWLPGQGTTCLACWQSLLAARAATCLRGAACC